MLTLNSYSPSTTLTIIILLLGIAVIFSSQLYCYWDGCSISPDADEQVPAQLWVKKENTFIEKVTSVRYDKYISNDHFEWRWISDLRKMGWVEDSPPAEVSIICSEGMKDTAHKIVKAAKK